MIAGEYSIHATRRCQQRAIPDFVIDLLERCGTSMRCGHADRLFFDKAAKKRLKHYLGGERGMRMIDRWLGVYVVVGDNGRVVTAAHKSGRYFRQ